MAHPGARRLGAAGGARGHPRIGGMVRAGQRRGSPGLPGRRRGGDAVRPGRTRDGVAAAGRRTHRVGGPRGARGLAVGRSRGRRSPQTVRLALRLAWARRVLQAVPEAGDWAAGAVALVVARELFLAGRLAGRPRDPPPAGHRRRMGAGRQPAARCATPCRHRPRGRSTASRSPATCGAPRWPGGGASSRTRRVSRMRRSWASRWSIGSVVSLGVDAWRTAAALEVRGARRRRGLLRGLRSRCLITASRRR